MEARRVVVVDVAFSLGIIDSSEFPFAKVGISPFVRLILPKLSTATSSFGFSSSVGEVI